MKTSRGMGILEDLNVNVEACRDNLEEHGNVDIVQGQRLIFQILTFAQVSLYFCLLRGGGCA